MAFIKIIDETKKCLVCINENPSEKEKKELKDEGFFDGEFEEGWDGIPYLKGYAPAKPQNIINSERITELQNYLNATDWYAVRFAETGAEIPEDIKAARQSAREEISRLRGDDDQDNSQMDPLH